MYGKTARVLATESESFLDQLLFESHDRKNYSWTLREIRERPNLNLGFAQEEAERRFINKSEIRKLHKGGEIKSENYVFSSKVTREK